MLARRISVRQDQADLSGTGDEGGIEIIRKQQEPTQSGTTGPALDESDKYKWIHVGWCHPAAPTAFRALESEPVDSDIEGCMKRSPVTALASFGSSVVVTGGLDGSVFWAHSISDGQGRATGPSCRGIHLDWGSASRAGVGASSDGEYGMEAVSSALLRHREVAI